MAVATITFVGTKAEDAENAADFSAGEDDADIFVEGTQSVGLKTSGTLTRFISSTIAGGPYDFSSGGTDEGEHIWVWFNGLTPLDGTSGMRIIVGDSIAGDQAEWDVGPPTGYGGGWLARVIDPARDFDRSIIGSWTLAGNPAQLTNIDELGGGIQTTTTIMGNFHNALVDAMSIGLGYRATRGDSTDADATFGDFVTFEQSTSNSFGALRSIAGVLFLTSKLLIGDAGSAAPTNFTDDGFTVLWENALVASTFYELRVEDDGTNATVLNISNGLLAAESGVEFLLQLAGLTSSGSSVTFTNINTDRARLVNLDGNVSWTDGQIANSGTIDLGGQPTFTGITVLDPTDGFAMEVNATNELDNVSDIQFDGAGIGGSGNGAIFINITGAGPFTLDFTNIRFANRITNSHDVVIAANDNADYTINVLSDGDTPTVNNLGTGTVTVVNAVTLTITNIENDSEVRIQRTGTTILEFHEENVTGNQIQYNFDSPPGFNVDIFIHHLDFKWFSLINFTLPSTNSSIPVSQIPDRTFENP